MKTRTIQPDKISVITLGCSKNLVDSENLITQLREEQFEVIHDQDVDANVVIVNTCGFIDLAKEESVNTILHYSREKMQGNIEKLFVTGCLSERYREELAREIPEVDAWFGTLELPQLLARFQVDYKHDLIGERNLVTPPHFAYLKISEGCNRTCSFCAIPLMRGKHRSRPIEELVEEARGLASRGVKELLLIAQELTYYGLDIYRERALPRLLHTLADIEGIEWIRLHYAYPSKFPKEIFDVMKERKEVCNYLDIPLQHASDSVLRRMRRQITRQETEDLIKYARKTVPGIAIRTTFLVGYPGETKEEFQELCDFVEQMRFDRVGVFQYSHEENTSAYLEADNIQAREKTRRANRIMEIQQAISFEKNQELVGRKIRVLFDRKEGEYFIGRTEFDSPEVDNEVLVDAKDYFVRIGDFADVEITEALEYDLFGKLA